MKRNLISLLLLMSAASLMAVPALRSVKGTDALYRGCNHRGQRDAAVERRYATGKNHHSLERQTPPRVLVILTQFQNKQFREENGIEVWKQFFAGEGVSVKQYFTDQSFGQYVPEFDVVGPVTLENIYEYYGKNIDGEDQAAEEMIVDACLKADAAGVDFSKYDGDGDGYVDCVYVLYAGKGEADSKDENSVWPHNYRIEDMDYECVVDGKRVNVYVCSNEIKANQKREGIGTACHEFSHVLGLPDMYPTNGTEDYKTLGAWDLMDYGAYNNETMTPPAYSAYERWFMGWTEPYLMSEPMNFVLQDINKKGDCGIITADGQSNLNGLMPDPTEFCLIENRQQTKGSWDEYLPGHGMLMTKVKFVYSRWQYNEVNNLEHNMSIDLIEADGYAPKYSWYWEGSVQVESDNGYRGKKGDAFPAGATYYTPFKNYPLTNISENNGVIRFDFMGGVSSCTVTFYSNSQYGTCTSDPVTVGKNGSVVLPGVNAKANYTFLGWATSKHSTVADAGQQGDLFYPMSDCTLYALWRDDTKWLINYTCKGVIWEAGNTAYVKRDQNCDIYFITDDGYEVPTAKNCQVKVTCGQKPVGTYSFENEGVHIHIDAADIDDNIYIAINNARIQKGGVCEAYSHTFTGQCYTGEQKLSGYYWQVSVSNSSADTGYDKHKGASFGSGSKPAQQVHLITEETEDCAVAQVRVEASVASQGDAVLNVMIGGNIVGETESLETDNAEYVFTPSEPVSGKLDIRFVNTQKTIYIKSVNITYAKKEDKPSADEQVQSAAWTIGSDNGMVYATGIQEQVRVRVFNAIGQTVVDTESDRDITVALARGIYVVKIENGKKQLTKKILIY